METLRLSISQLKKDMQEISAILDQFCRQYDLKLWMMPQTQSQSTHDPN